MVDSLVSYKIYAHFPVYILCLMTSKTGFRLAWLCSRAT